MLNRSGLAEMGGVQRARTGQNVAFLVDAKSLRTP